MKLSFPPAELWIGSHEQLIVHVQQHLQKVFCPHKACATCKICLSIATQQHHATMWLYPDKQYTVASLEPILQTISYKLETDQHFFFILQKADALTEICQNTLLKTIEEPRAGYHFLLLSEKKERLLPTIQSRCHITAWKTKDTFESSNPFVEFFTQKTLNARILLDEIEKNVPHERESIEILDTIIAYWLKQYAKSIKDNNDSEEIQNKLKLLMSTQHKPAMPGSSKLFWKNIFLQWH